MALHFTKMHGLGNDFIIIDDRLENISKRTEYGDLAKQLCDRRNSVGADGIILLLESLTHDYRFRIFNSDGSEAEMCGNGMRCFAKYLYTTGISDKTILRIETKAGTIIPELNLNANGIPETVTVDMGVPELSPMKIPYKSHLKQAVSDPIDVNGSTYNITVVSMGNPHAVLFVDDINQAPVSTLGPQLEHHEHFPKKTNVEFIEVQSETRMRMKVWERGAGITLACGTGACAALVAGVLNNKVNNRATIVLDGGELIIEWDKNSGHIKKTGPATLAFHGQTGELF